MVGNMPTATMATALFYYTLCPRSVVILQPLEALEPSKAAERTRLQQKTQFGAIEIRGINKG